MVSARQNGDDDKPTKAPNSGGRGFEVRVDGIGQIPNIGFTAMYPAVWESLGRKDNNSRQTGKQKKRRTYERREGVGLILWREKKTFCVWLSHGEGGKKGGTKKIGDRWGKEPLERGELGDIV